MEVQGDNRKRFTKAEREAVYQKTDGHCAYCGREITIREMQIDHVIPIKFQDREQRDLNAMDNLLPACRPCNKYKHTLTVDKFRFALQQEPGILRRDSVAYRNALRFGLIKETPKNIVFYFEREESNGNKTFWL